MAPVPEILPLTVVLLAPLKVMVLLLEIGLPKVRFPAAALMASGELLTASARLTVVALAELLVTPVIVRGVEASKPEEP
jgi:hypothetical protein